MWDANRPNQFGNQEVIPDPNSILPSSAHRKNALRTWAEQAVSASLSVGLRRQPVGRTGQVFEIAVVDEDDGELRLSERVRPQCAEFYALSDDEVLAHYGVSRACLLELPSWSQVWAKLEPMLQGRELVFADVYSDCRAIEASCEASGITCPDLVHQSHCILVGEFLSGGDLLPDGLRYLGCGPPAAWKIAGITSEKFGELVELSDL